MRRLFGQRSIVSLDYLFYPRTAAKACNLMGNKLISSKKELSDESSTVAMEFFKACLETSIHVSESEQSIVRDTAKMTIVEGNDITAYILPSSVEMFPSFFSNKQRGASCKHLYMQQTSATHTRRFNDIVRELRGGKRIVGTGLSGIGKSMEMNLYLMEFLKNINSEGWPEQVWYRYDSYMLKFSILNGKPIVCEASARSLDDVLDLTRSAESMNVVLLLEMQEKEEDPRTFVPTLVQPSNSDIYSLTKTFSKASDVDYYLINPPSRISMCSMARFMLRFGTDSVFEGMTPAAVDKLVTARFDVAGPSLRAVFTDESSLSIPQTIGF